MRTELSICHSFTIQTSLASEGQVAVSRISCCTSVSKCTSIVYTYKSHPFISWSLGSFHLLSMQNGRCFQFITLSPDSFPQEGANEMWFLWKRYCKCLGWASMYWVNVVIQHTFTFSGEGFGGRGLAENKLYWQRDNFADASASALGVICRYTHVDKDPGVNLTLSAIPILFCQSWGAGKWKS